MITPIPRVKTDKSPQLGGNLDINGNQIVSTNDGNIVLAPHGSGLVVVNGLSLPGSDGGAGQVWTTNGAGVISFTTLSAGAEDWLDSVLDIRSTPPESPSDGDRHLITGGTPAAWQSLAGDFSRASSHMLSATINGNQGKSGQNFSFACKVVIESDSDGTNRHLVTWASGESYWVSIVVDTDGKLSYVWWRNNPEYRFAPTVKQSDTVVPLDTEVTIGVVHTSSNSVTFYLNGVADGTVDVSNAASSSGVSTMFLGMAAKIPTGFFGSASDAYEIKGFDGAIAQPVEWNSAVSSTVMANYHNGDDPSTLSPTRYWEDLTGNAPHAPEDGSGNLTQFDVWGQPGDWTPINPSAGGVWAGHEDETGTWDDGGSVWTYETPNEGATLTVEDEDKVYRYTGSAWGEWTMGDVFGPSSSTDNTLPRFDGTGGKTLQSSAVVVDDSDNVSGMATLTLPNTGLHLLDTNGSHDLIIAPGSDLTADRTLTLTTGDANRTITLDRDVNLGSGGTFAENSHNHAAGDVTSGTFDDSRIAQSNVTQHQGALSITESQISDHGIYATQAAVDLLDSSYSRRKKVIDYVDNTSAPPTEVTGDRYLLDDTGASHVDWDGAAALSLVEFNGATWDEVAPIEGYIVYVDVEDQDRLYVDDGSPAWEPRVAGSGVSSLNGETVSTQTFAKADDDNVTLTIGSSGGVHTFTLGWSGTLANGRVAESNVTQHQAALAIGLSQVTDADPIAGKKSNLSASAAPSATDDTSESYAVGSVWIDTTADKVYQCVDATEDAAVWAELSPTSSSSSNIQSADTHTKVTTEAVTGAVVVSAENNAGDGSVEIGRFDSDASDRPQFLLPDGATAAPSLAFASDKDTGILLASTGLLAIICGADSKGVFASDHIRFTEVVRIDGGKNLVVGQNASPANGSNAIHINIGGAPTTTLGNCAAIYSKDVSSSAELFVMDEATNETQLSPHPYDAEFMKRHDADPAIPWGYSSTNKKAGIRVNADMLGVIRTVQRIAKYLKEQLGLTDEEIDGLLEVIKLEEATNGQ